MASRRNRCKDKGRPGRKRLSMWREWYTQYLYPGSTGWLTRDNLEFNKDRAFKPLGIRYQVVANRPVLCQVCAYGQIANHRWNRTFLCWSDPNQKLSEDYITMVSKGLWWTWNLNGLWRTLPGQGFEEQTDDVEYGNYFGAISPGNAVRMP